MRKILFLTFIFPVCHFVYSQSLDVTYHTDYILNAASSKDSKADKMILHIEKGASEFYSILNQNRQEVISRLGKQGLSYNDAQKELSKVPRSFLDFRIYKNYPQKGILTYTNRVITNYYKYEETMEKPQWTLQKETKEIIDHKCQKATTYFKGRTWTVWYTSEIPVQEGPWKLWGLPGLILEAQDSDSLYHFLAIGLKKTNASPISLYKRKIYINCTRKEYIQQKEDCQKDMIAYINKNTNGNITISRPKDKKFTEPHTTKYIDIEIDKK
jgi:GLPGLI family protein